jgi:DNA primase
LIEANRVAAQFFAEALNLPEAQVGRDFLRSRGFDRAVAERYGIGYAPDTWDSVLRHLRGNGFTEAEIAGAGLVSRGQRGHFDRFRGRLIWPIRDLTGAVIGFGARQLGDSADGPKYLNTPETPLYHKSQVLYGVDLAKREIGRQRQAVIVEGYTDVMAAHLAGVPTAIATCGTAFGEDHVRVVRRLLGDSAATAVRGRVVFTFDGDEAGQKAALRAFEQDQGFYADTFVAVAPDGMDPCDLRLARGDDAVRQLVDGAIPLFKFAVLAVLRQLDLDTPEGRVAGLRYAAPIVARLRDQTLRAEYTRLLAGWLGLREPQVRDEVRRAAQSSRGGSGLGPRPGSGRVGGSGEPGTGETPGGPEDGPAPARASAEPSRSVRQAGPGASGGAGAARSSARTGTGGAPGDLPERVGPPGRGSGPAGPGVSPGRPWPGGRPGQRADTVSKLEYGVLMAVLQAPEVAPGAFDTLEGDAFLVPEYRAVHDAIRAAGGVATADGPGGPVKWLERVREAAPSVVSSLVTEMAVVPLPITQSPAAAIPGEDVDKRRDYVHGMVARLMEAVVVRQIGDLRSRLGRMTATGDAAEQGLLLERLQALEAERRQWRFDT